MTDCRVAAIGRELAELSREWARLDGEGCAVQGARKIRLDRMEREVLDRIDLLQAEACGTLATSPAGAMVQTMLAYDLANKLYEFIPDDAPAYEVSALLRALTRALYSAVDAIAATTGEDPNSLGADHFMAHEWHPFHLCERAHTTTSNK
ncbi:hypothetical protein [Stappia indica]|uniref:hypothetical protein n=1 Tax=Stappia indica TaxID=538381 RepID=UPI001CD667DA|nr:hypothetical protein [Stappia indica]MCA1298503.1 hypothetical protein [Stappia indica]